MRRKRSTVAFANLLLLFGGTAIAFLLAEGAARLFFTAKPAVRIENLTAGPVEMPQDFVLNDGKRVTQHYATGGLHSYGPTGARLLPNKHVIVQNSRLADFRDIEIKTNSLGYRHPELGPKDESELRILVLGDSITITDYLQFDEMFTTVAQRRLAEQPPAGLAGKKIEVINAGIGGIELANALAVLAETGLKTAPDVVVVGLYLNDARESPLLEITRLPTSLQWSRLAATLADRFDKFRLLNKFDYQYEWQAETIERERAAFLRKHSGVSSDWLSNDPASLNTVIAEFFDDWGYAWTEAYWAKILPVVDLFQDLSRTNDFKLAFLFFPVSYQVEAPYLRNEPQERFKAEMAKRGLPHMDMLPLLRAEFRRSQERLFGDHCHYTAYGCTIIGKALAGFLAEQVIPAQ